MQITPGTRLGRHEILAPLGAGSMGEVQRIAEDHLADAIAMLMAGRDRPR